MLNAFILREIWKKSEIMQKTEKKVMSNNNTNEKGNQFNRESINLLRDTAQNEYSNELKRTSSIDSKAGIALPIIVAYFLSIAQMNDFNMIVAMPVSKLSEAIVPMLTLLSYIISLISAIFAVIWMGRVILARGYSIIEPKDLYTEDYLKLDCKVLSIDLLRLYLEATDDNRKVNSARITLYMKGWIFSLVSITSFVIYIVMKNNFYV